MSATGSVHRRQRHHGREIARRVERDDAQAGEHGRRHALGEASGQGLPPPRGAVRLEPELAGRLLKGGQVGQVEAEFLHLGFSPEGKNL